MHKWKVNRSVGPEPPAKRIVPPGMSIVHSAFRNGQIPNSGVGVSLQNLFNSGSTPDLASMEDMPTAGQVVLKTTIHGNT